VSTDDVNEAHSMDVVLRWNLSSQWINELKSSTNQPRSSCGTFIYVEHAIILHASSWYKLLSKSCRKI
jgi:hypothetical protein